MSHGALKKMVETEKLPLGHYSRSKAAKAVERIYQKCHAINAKWHRRFPKWVHGQWSVDQAKKHCNELCRALGERNMIRKIVPYSTDVYCAAAAHYCCNEIHFKWSITYGTLIHELAHHCSRAHDHGDWFCEVLEMLFKVSYEILTGKKPKADW